MSHHLFHKRNFEKPNIQHRPICDHCCGGTYVCISELHCLVLLAASSDTARGFHHSSANHSRSSILQPIFQLPNFDPDLLRKGAFLRQEQKRDGPNNQWSMVIAESAVNLYPFFNAKFFCQVPGVCLSLKNEAFVTEFMPISRTAWKNIKVCIYLYQGDFHADIDRHYMPVEGSRQTIHIFSFDCTLILLLLLLLRGYNVLSIFPIWARPLWKYWLAPL